MEEILASIRRIISEDDAPAAEAEAAPEAEHEPEPVPEPVVALAKPEPEPDPAPVEDVLELTQRVEPPPPETVGDLDHYLAEHHVGLDFAAIAKRTASPDVNGILNSLTGAGAVPEPVYRKALQQRSLLQDAYRGHKAVQ